MYKWLCGKKTNIQRVEIADQDLGFHTLQALKKANREVTEGLQGNAESGILKLEIDYICKKIMFSGIERFA